MRRQQSRAQLLLPRPMCSPFVPLALHVRPCRCMHARTRPSNAPRLCRTQEILCHHIAGTARHSQVHEGAFAARATMHPFIHSKAPDASSLRPLARRPSGLRPRGLVCPSRSNDTSSSAAAGTRQRGEEGRSIYSACYNGRTT